MPEEHQNTKVTTYITRVPHLLLLCILALELSQSDAHGQHLLPMYFITPSYVTLAYETMGLQVGMVQGGPLTLLLTHLPSSHTVPWRYLQQVLTIHARLHW